MGAPTSKASCLREIDTLTRQYQQCMRNIESLQTNIITNPQWKSNYKARIQENKARASAIKAEIAKVKAQMKGLK